MDEALRLRAHASRAKIIAGVLRGAALEEQLLAIPFCDRDVWTDEVLGLDAPPPDVDLPRGSVPYLPCGVDSILSMVREVPLRAADVLVDLGSGLGRVAILAHLLTGARAGGVEIQEPLVRGARARCEALGLSDVAFVQGDASRAALDGSVFFLYAPFNGAMLAAVLVRLAEVARRRPIVVCAVDLELDDAPWLHRRAARSSSASIAIYDSRAVELSAP